MVRVLQCRGGLLRRQVDHAAHVGRRDRARAAGPRRIVLERGHPPVRNRGRHRATFSGVTRICAAISRFCHPAAANSTIWARSTLRAEARRARPRASNTSRCSSLNATSGATRIVSPSSCLGSTTHTRYSLRLQAQYTSRACWATPVCAPAHCPAWPGRSSQREPMYFHSWAGRVARAVLDRQLRLWPITAAT